VGKTTPGGRQYSSLFPKGNTHLRSHCSARPPAPRRIRATTQLPLAQDQPNSVADPVQEQTGADFRLGNQENGISPAAAPQARLLRRSPVE
jgi:hypothetical protein